MEIFYFFQCRVYFFSTSTFYWYLSSLSLKRLFLIRNFFYFLSTLLWRWLSWQVPLILQSSSGGEHSPWLLCLISVRISSLVSSKSSASLDLAVQDFKEELRELKQAYFLMGLVFLTRFKYYCSQFRPTKLQLFCVLVMGEIYKELRLKMLSLDDSARACRQVDGSIEAILAMLITFCLFFFTSIIIITSSKILNPKCSPSLPQSFPNFSPSDLEYLCDHQQYLFNLQCQLIRSYNQQLAIIIKPGPSYQQKTMQKLLISAR